MNQPKEFRQIVEMMNEAELHALHALVRDRLEFFRRMRDLHSLQQFRPFDEVMFHSGGEHITGVVVRVNRRTVTVRTNARGQWHVSPAFLTKVRENTSVSEDKGVSVFHSIRHEGAPVFVVSEKEQLFAGISRNAPCPCGSGKKYKKCHGK